jgi:hypothetical protein
MDGLMTISATTSRFYADEKTSASRLTEGTLQRAGIALDLRKIMNPTRKCDYCSHTRAAHVDGRRCALCDCTSEVRAFVQESFAFRSAVPTQRWRPNTRKR